MNKGEARGHKAYGFRFRVRIHDFKYRLYSSYISSSSLGFGVQGLGYLDKCSAI